MVKSLPSNPGDTFDPMPVTQVSLCPATIKPVLQARGCSYSAHTPQLRKPTHCHCCSLQALLPMLYKRSYCAETSATQLEEPLPSPTGKDKPAKQRRPSTPKIKQVIFFLIIQLIISLNAKNGFDKI